MCILKIYQIHQKFSLLISSSNFLRRLNSLVYAWSKFFRTFFLNNALLWLISISSSMCDAIKLALTFGILFKWQLQSMTIHPWDFDQIFLRLDGYRIQIFIWFDPNTSICFKVAIWFIWIWIWNPLDSSFALNVFISRLKINHYWAP